MGFFIFFLVSVGGVEEVELLFVFYYIQGLDIMGNIGICIVLDVLVWVMGVYYWAYFLEVMYLLFELELGIEYFFICYVDDIGNDFFLFVVFSIEDGIEIEIMFVVLILGFCLFGVFFMIMFNVGQIYQVQVVEDLIGSRVCSIVGQLIVVFFGVKQVDIIDCG